MLLLYTYLFCNDVVACSIVTFIRNSLLALTTQATSSFLHLALTLTFTLLKLFSSRFKGIIFLSKWAACDLPQWIIEAVECNAADEKLVPNAF